MKRVLVVVLAVVFAGALMGSALAEEISATITEINLEANTVTLDPGSGKAVEFKAAEGVDLSAFTEGDVVNAEVKGNTITSIELEEVEGD